MDIWMFLSFDVRYDNAETESSLMDKCQAMSLQDVVNCEHAKSYLQSEILLKCSIDQIYIFRKNSMFKTGDDYGCILPIRGVGPTKILVNFKNVLLP